MSQNDAPDMIWIDPKDSTFDLAAPDAAQWSKELPKKSGWYFMRNEGEEPIADGLVVWVGYNASGIRHEGKFFYADDGFLKRREFLGPITTALFNADAVRQARRETWEEAAKIVDKRGQCICPFNTDEFPHNESCPKGILSVLRARRNLKHEAGDVAEKANGTTKTLA